MRNYNHYGMKPAEQINEAIEQLPTAKMWKLTAHQKDDEGTITESRNVPNFTTVCVTDNKGNNSFVYCPKGRYKIVQHNEAFRPIIEGLTLAGVNDYRFHINANHNKANLQIYSGVTGYDTVALGFNVSNTFDGTGAIKYGMKMSRVNSTIEIVGYRQVCSNGMIIRVPIEESEFVREELKVEVLELIKKLNFSFKHSKTVFDRLQTVQYAVEAISILREPVELMIKKAQNWKISDAAQLDYLVKKHISKRLRNKVLAQFGDETNDLWGLYNAITYVASHDERMKESSRNALLNQAADLLVVELVEA
jgi:hypothetical protein